jgi:lipopolysaccharide/colanic/teichoic acid biosynthesis glycosyltransferase
MDTTIRYFPIVRNLEIRTTIGFILLISSIILTERVLEKGSLGAILTIMTFSWMVSSFLTSKYVHKYPQRYYSYLVASHLKAALIMAFLISITIRITNLNSDSYEVLWKAFIFFSCSDFIISVPRNREFPEKPISHIIKSLIAGSVADEEPSSSGYTNRTASLSNKEVILGQVRTEVDNSLVEFIKMNLPESQNGNADVQILDDINSKRDQSKIAPMGLLIGRTRLNDVKRLNQFLQFCTARITMGGYIVGRYVPLETLARNLRKRYPGFLYWLVSMLHFIWYRALPKTPFLDRLYFSAAFSWCDRIYLGLTKKRNRVLSKAEVWGRLSYFGMQVIAESEMSDERYFIAQRRTNPVHGKKPSYYLIARLEKVGLDGKSIYTHKIRTMYAFSEFLQKRVFHDHGLSATGKFANDFRLTEYGRFLRKYWLDELPQIFDWLRGDVKLVGIRATSRHFLSLYPRKFLELYIQVKPGLIPPIFDESTNGFEQIVEVELKYLQRYWEQPLRTDVRYFIQTFNGIVFKGIRSR